MAVTQSSAIVDEMLTMVSKQYIPDGYISEKVFPLIQVNKYSGKIAGYGQEHLIIESMVHVGKGPYPSIQTSNRSQTTFQLQTLGLSNMITKEDFANVQDPYEARQDAIIELTTLMWLAKEKGLADLLTNASLYPDSNKEILSGDGQYSNEDDSNPLADFADAQNAIADKSGRPPNKAIMDDKTFRQLNKHPQLLGRAGYDHTRAGLLSVDELKTLMMVDELLIADVRYNIEPEGLIPDMKPVWGTNIVFLVAPKHAQKRQVSAGYRLQTGSPRRVQTNIIRNPIGAEEIVMDDIYTMLISDIKAAYLIKDTIAVA